MTLKLLLVSLCVGLIAGAPASMEKATVAITPNHCDDYTPFHDVCIQVKTDRATFYEAEADCVIEGGHLMSIHNNYDNDRLWNLISHWLPNAQSVLLGLQTDGSPLYTYTDGSKSDYSNWAKYFPLQYFGTAAELFLKDNELGSAGQWANVDQNTKMNYVCVRPNDVPPTVCPNMQLLTDNGEIKSPGYPMAMASHTNCEYIMAVPQGKTIEIVFFEFETDDSTTVKLYDGLTAVTPMKILSGSLDSPNERYTSTSNIMRLVYTSAKKAHGKGWAAVFHPIPYF